jgi:hypothetical protein
VTRVRHREASRKTGAVPMSAKDGLRLHTASELQCEIEDNCPKTVKFGQFKKSEVIRILDNVSEFFGTLADVTANREIIK